MVALEPTLAPQEKLSAGTNYRTKHKTMEQFKKKEKEKDAWFSLMIAHATN